MDEEANYIPRRHRTRTLRFTIEGKGSRQRAGVGEEPLGCSTHVGPSRHREFNRVEQRPGNDRRRQGRVGQTLKWIHMDL
jgi:hypothetical protein